MTVVVLHKAIVDILSLITLEARTFFDLRSKELHERE